MCQKAGSSDAWMRRKLAATPALVTAIATEMVHAKTAPDRVTATSMVCKQYSLPGPVVLEKHAKEQPVVMKKQESQRMSPITQDDRSAWEEITELADEYRVTSACSQAQAIAAVAREHPELVQRYRAEPKPSAAPVVTKRAVPEPHWSFVKMQKLAKEKVANGEAKTLEQAITKVADEQPTLLRAYKERRRA